MASLQVGTWSESMSLAARFRGSEVSQILICNKVAIPNFLLLQHIKSSLLIFLEPAVLGNKLPQ